MRWKLELRSLTGARERAFTLLLVLPGMLLFSLLTSLLVFAGVRALGRGDGAALLPMLSVAVTGLGILWALSPLLAGVAFTETHDMARLLHFPIPLRTLVASSLLANLIQPMVLAELPVALALALGLVGSSLALPLALLGVLSTVAFTLVAAQCTGLLLHAVSRNRRLQDVVLFAGLLMGIVIGLLPMVMFAGARFQPRVLRRAFSGDAFAWSPFAWGVRAAVHASDGDWGGFAVMEAAQLLAIAGGVALATVLVSRVYRGDLALGPSARAGVGRARMRLGGPIGALLEKDLRVAWRDPAAKATLLMGLVGPVILLLFLFHTGGRATSLVMLAVLVGGAVFGSNTFGQERRGVALLMNFPVERWRILVAKNLAAMALRGPGLLVLVAACLMLGSPAYLPAVLTAAAATMLIAAGADNYVSILFPLAAPDPARNPYGGGSAGGRGLGAVVLNALLFALTLTVAAPFVFLCWLPLLLEAPLLWLLALPLALVGAGAVYALLVGGAERLLRRREPELLERILAEA
jgi:ABC-2 type transport system permease protein